MAIRLTVRDDSITEGMKRYATEKAERLTRFFDGVIGIEVILDVDGPLQKAEIILSIAKADPIAAHATQEQTNAAIDLCVDKAERLLVKHKEKLRDHRAASKSPVAPPRTERSGEDLPSYDDIIDEREFPS